MAVVPGETVLLDRYEVVRELGEGGMGRVLEAYDRHLERKVAIKLLRDEDGIDPEERARRSTRALREARAAAKLSHPGVVQIFDVGELDGAPFLVMELVDGSDLRSARLAQAEKVRVLVEVARALEAAHQAGIVHRDVKPDNVMMRADGSVKVLDFGIARRTAAAKDGALAQPGTLTAQGIRVGTPAYMSPEQIKGDAAGEASDQFSWGVLAHELLGGKLPWKAADSLTLVASILADTPAPLSNVEPAIESLVLKSLSKDPKDRFGSMRELREELEAVVLGTAPTTASTPPPPRQPVSTPPAPRMPAAPRAPHLSPSGPRATTDFRRYSTQEMQEILERALKAPVDQQRGYSKADIVEAAREVGIDEAAVRAAAATVGGKDLMEAHRREQWRGLYRHAGIWAVCFVVASIMAITVKENFKILVPIWFWLIGLGAHAVGVLFPKAPSERRLRRLERRLAMQRGDRAARLRIQEPEIEQGVRVLLDNATERRRFEEAIAEDEAVREKRRR